MDRPSKPVRVAVIGGGCASVSTAFELSRPEHQGRFEVTVYQLGWRLGGKGASGRGPNGRIEEHGLHVWLGFYENAFRLMRECYAELARDPKQCHIADWRDAFFADPFVGMADRDRDGQWLQWTALFPDAGGLPGDPIAQDNPFTIHGYLTRTVALLKTLVFDVHTRRAADTAPPSPETAGDTSGLDESNSADTIAGLLNRLSRVGVLGTTTGLIEAFGLLELVVRAASRPSSNSLMNLLQNNLVSRGIVELLQDIARTMRSNLERTVRQDDSNRYVWEIIDLVIAIMVGIVREGLIYDPRGFDAINDRECREWLLENGASEHAVDSAFVRGLFDLAMAYPGGDAQRPALAAGQAIRGSLRMFFTYRGALFWKMRAGMGDIVFAPFYEVLKKRGVRFEFFHRLENVGLSDDASHVASLRFDVQAHIRNDAAYNPLVDVKGLPCWPARPDYTQLVDGDSPGIREREFESFWDTGKAAEKTLHVSQDFDCVVLGVGVGAIPHLCPEILQRDARWRDMVKHVTSVPSQAFQLWMREDMAELGWEGPPPTLSAFAKPFDTWADMRHLVAEEDWPQAPRSIAYFCGVLSDAQHPVARSDSDYPEQRHEEVRRNAIGFLNNHVASLWPRSVDMSGSFRWDLLLDHDGSSSASGETAFDSQFWTANVNPSDRYTLAPPGSMEYRLSPLDNTYDNLALVGDWTDCGFNEGCVEAAVMSGRLGAHAISGFPALEDIIGYDHP